LTQNLPNLNSLNYDLNLYFIYIVLSGTARDLISNIPMRVQLPGSEVARGEAQRGHGLPKILALLNFGRNLNQSMPKMCYFCKKLQKLLRVGTSSEPRFLILSWYYKHFQPVLQAKKAFDCYRHLQK